MDLLDNAKLIAELKLAKPEINASMIPLANTIIENFEEDGFLSDFSKNAIKDITSLTKLSISPRGGSREGAGRDRIENGLQVRRNISMSHEMAEKAKRIGHGNLSAGIRRAVENYDGENQ